MTSLQAKGFIFILSGPSGAGKTTLVSRLLEDPDLKRVMAKSVSFTTRPMRSGEKQGENYFFITRAQFKKDLAAKKILEWTRYLGYYYATRAEVVTAQLEKGKSVILCLDKKGVENVRALYPGRVKAFFILPPSLEVLRQRIEKRCRHTKGKEVQARLRLAAREMMSSRLYDFRLTNSDLDQTTRELKEIITGIIKS